MLSNQQASQPGNRRDFAPPNLARNILSFFLPATLRDPILGDLEEEFTLRICSNRSLFQVNRWYWWQVVQSSCLFFWQQRGAGMAYLMSVIFFLFIVGLAIATSTYGMWFISPNTIIFVIPTSLILGIGATSFRTAKTALKLSFSDSSEHSPQIVRAACRFLRVTGNQFLLVAGIVFFLGLINVLLIFSQNPELLDDPIHISRYGVGLMPLFYGLVFKSLFYSAEQKLLGRYLPE